MAMINGDTEQAFGLAEKTKNEALEIMEKLEKYGIVKYDDLMDIVETEAIPDIELRSQIKSFKVKRCVDLVDYIKTIQLQ